MFKITKAKFDISISGIQQYLEVSNAYNVPEICVVGRSNVGKSSFINCLASQKKLAKTSSLPGRTRLINVFDFNEGLFKLIDLPGYGYAAASKTAKEEWSGLIEGYLEASKKLIHVFALVDIRHDPSPLDVSMLKYLFYYGLPFTVVATKSDKLSKSQINAGVMNIATKLAIGKDNIIAFSSQTGNGKDATERRIREVLTVAANPIIVEDEDE